MAETAEPAVEPVESVDSTSNAGPINLAQYVSEVEAITGEKVTNDPKPVDETAEATAEPSLDKEESSKEEPSAKPAPAPKKEPARQPARPKPLELTEEHFSDPRVQAEIDRRAAALERSKRAEVEARAAEEARQQAQLEYDSLVDLANGPEFDDEANAARQKLASMASTQRIRDSLYREVAPAVRGAVLEDFSAQISQAYSQIPEFQYQEVVDALHHSLYDNAGNWVVNTINGVSAIRVASKDREWSEKFDAAVNAKAKEVAEGMNAEFMADQRSKLPNPDVSPAVTDGKEERRYRNRLELARDVDTILPRLGPVAYRQLRDSLPEAE